MAKWTARDITHQSGRRFVVTGANSGLGASTAHALAAAGAHVVLACRSVAKGERAAADMRGDVEVRELDLADLASIRQFTQTVGAVDVLINNAGVMAVPKARTKDGFESQIGVNHLGHFALTGLLLGRLTDRVVTVTSAMHRLGRIDLDDLNWERRRYQRWLGYSQSKLANLMFALELQRRLTASGSAVRSMAAHPGYASTNLQSHTQSFQDRVMALGNRIAAQSADMGALPTLYAATQDLPGGSFAGPDGLGGMHGHPTLVRSASAARDAAVAARLWTISEKLTGVTYL